MSIDQLEAEMLKLAPHQRARLAKQRLSSLDEDAQVEEPCLALAADGYNKVKSGEMKTVLAAEALAKVGKSLEHR